MKRLAMVLSLLIAAVACAAAQAPANAPSSIEIATKDEPGERLVVTGIVTDAEGKPLPGATVYVHHTDINGYYSGTTTSNANPRLRGWMTTDAAGRYEFRTIKPGAYPNARVPSHVHYEVTAPGFQKKVFEILFEGDPFINDRIRNDARNEESIYSIRRLTRDKDGAWRCTQDIRLKRD